MIGLLYLIISFFAGAVLCTIAFPRLKESCSNSYHNSKIQLSPWLVLLPAWFLTGTIALTWVTYLVAYCFREKNSPLIYGNTIAMSLFFLGIVCFYITRLQKGKTPKVHMERPSQAEWIIFTAVGILAITLMWKTLYVKGNSLFVGYTVFSDFSPHLGMIRSFSYGNNFPTTYSHFAGEDIKYHFMFQFLAGNLEFLGMRIDYAFNLPSMLGLMATVMLLYAFAVKLTEKKTVGYFSILFFLFRSSFSVFEFIKEREPGIGIIQALVQNKEFIGYTTHEDWGLWNLNVYCNQRHLGFTLGVLLFVLMQYMPNLYEGILYKSKITAMQSSVDKTATGKSTLLQRFKVWSWCLIKECFFTREGWQVLNMRQAVFCGILLGALGFFNGATTIATLLVLFAMAILARRRIEFLVTALIAVFLTLLQSKFFIHGSAVELTMKFGFIAENKSLAGVLDYIRKLTGVLPIVLAAALFLVQGIHKYLLLAFSFPFFFAFIISLTPDVTVNHKYIMISIMLLSILAASVIVRMKESKQGFIRALAVFLVFLLTATGLYDYRTVLKKNENAMIFSMKDPLTMWVKENATSQDIFLTHNYALNSLVLGGAMLYDGWQYFAWSAGYDTLGRDELVKQMYEAESREELALLVRDNNIRYIVVDNEVRKAVEYQVREDVIADTFEQVFYYNDNDSDTCIYDTWKAK